MSHVSTTDGLKLYYKDWGQGQPVVLVHGRPLSAASFDDLAIANAGMRAISYDRRGFGRSDQPWHGYDYDTLADDLASVLDQCAVGDATLAGFSMGGGEVARYLSRHGTRRINQVPTLIIHGTDDRTVPIDASGRQSVRGIPHATLLEYEGAPHGLFASRKERMISDVLAFLARGK